MKTFKLKFRCLPDLEVDAIENEDGKLCVSLHWFDAYRETEHLSPEEAIRLGSALIQAGAAAREKRS